MSLDRECGSTGRVWRSISASGNNASSSQVPAACAVKLQVVVAVVEMPLASLVAAIATTTP